MNELIIFIITMSYAYLRINYLVKTGNWEYAHIYKKLNYNIWHRFNDAIIGVNVIVLVSYLTQGYQEHAYLALATGNTILGINLITKYTLDCKHLDGLPMKSIVKSILSYYPMVVFSMIYLTTLSTSPQYSLFWLFKPSVMIQTIIMVLFATSVSSRCLLDDLIIKLYKLKKGV